MSVYRHSDIQPTLCSILSAKFESVKAKTTEEKKKKVLDATLAEFKNECERRADKGRSYAHYCIRGTDEDSNIVTGDEMIAVIKSYCRENGLKCETASCNLDKRFHYRNYLRYLQIS